MWVCLVELYDFLTEITIELVLLSVRLFTVFELAPYCLVDSGDNIESHEFPFVILIRELLDEQIIKFLNLELSRDIKGVNWVAEIVDPLLSYFIVF